MEDILEDFDFNCFHITFGTKSLDSRKYRRDVVLVVCTTVSRSLRADVIWVGCRTSSRAPLRTRGTLDSNDNSQASAIFKYLSLIFKPEELVEYRAKMAHDQGFRGLYFTDLQRLSEVVAMLDGSGKASVSYVCINPLKGRLIRERNLLVNPTDEQVNQIVAGPPGKTARDEDIAQYRWMFVDVDTIRVPELRETDKKEFDRLQHECSTDAEKARAKVVAHKVRAYLTEKGWPQPIICDSGNGFHLLFRTNLENTPFNVNQIADCLKALKQEFAAEVDADIDASVYNPARLTRAYGSTTRKGTDTPERPYRPNRIFDLKQPVGVVTLDNICSLAVSSPGYSKHSDGDMPELDESFEPQDWINHFEKQGAFAIEGDKTWQDKPILATDVCLFAGRKHSGAEFKSGFIIGDTFGYKCFSDECEGKTIKEIYKWLREEKNDDGSQKFKPYPKPIYKSLSLEELLEGFAEEATVEEQYAQQALQTEIEGDPAPAAPSAEPDAQTEEPQPAASAAVSRKSDDFDKLSTKLTHSMLRALLNHSDELYLDGFQHYVRRFKDRLGMNNVAKRKKEKGEVDEITIALPYGETLITIIKYVDAHKSLPDKDALKNFIDINEKMKKNAHKTEMVEYIDRVPDTPASTFDETAQRLLKVLDIRFELLSLSAALPILKDEEDIQGFRSAVRRNQNKSTVQDSNFSSGAWQEKTEEIYNRFERKLRGVDNARKFKTGFWTIDNSGANIGLDGDRAICFCGPSSNRKTTAVMSIALNFAIQGKNGIFFAGEHHHTKVLDKLTLQLGHFYKDNPEIGPIPGLSKWEGLNVTATEDDLEKVKKLLLKLKAGEIVPGYIEPQNIDVIAGGEENKIDALLAYAESTFNKYQWDFIIIDPIDTCMPSETVGGRGNTFQLKADAIQKLFNFSRHAFGGKGCMVIITAQFGSAAVRDIQKIQEKNQGAE